ncbi:S-antigen protein-like [Sorex fumeus]|uniref:S-antigen protein-like n=1 Tax=Sorex fumeus TaxID=62283 RepID=UPI0024ADAEF3|nr:S-antigen protein-like [Sorex fumeus]
MLAQSTNNSLLQTCFICKSARHHPLEDSMDMDRSPLRPQDYLYGYELTAGKDYHFKADYDENQRQPSLRRVSLGAGAKDELHIVEAEARDDKGRPVKVILATLKRSVLPTVSLGAFAITPPLVLRLKCGSGPVRISAQHLVPAEEDAEWEDEDEEEEEEEEEEDDDDDDNDVRLLSTSGKRSAPGRSGSKVLQKKARLAAEEEVGDDGGDGSDRDEGKDEGGDSSNSGGGGGGCSDSGGSYDSDGSSDGSYDSFGSDSSDGSDDNDDSDGNYYSYHSDDSDGSYDRYDSYDSYKRAGSYDSIAGYDSDGRDAEAAVMEVAPMQPRSGGSDGSCHGDSSDCRDGDEGEDGDGDDGSANDDDEGGDGSY